jgi:hypothetical protein
VASPAQRAQDIVGATLRVTVQDDRRRLDLVVPVWLELGDLAVEVASRLGLAQPPALLTAGGRRLPEGGTLQEAGVRHGAVLLLAERLAPGDLAALDAEPSAARGRVAVPTWVVDLAALAVVVAAVAAVWGGGEVLRQVTGALLLVAAVLALAPGGEPRLRAQRLHLVPWCLGGAALVAVGPSPQHELLPVAVAALGAFAAAGIVRALTDDHVVSMVWLWGAGAVAATATLLLVAGAGAPGLWSTLLAFALVWIRLLPGLVVDVPDDALLDLDTLAITAWSARDDQPRGTRRRRVVRRAEIRRLAREGGAMLRAGTAGAAVTAVVASGLLLATSGSLLPWAATGAQVMVGVGAAAIALLGRSYRDWQLQLLLRVSAATMAVLLARSVLLDLGPVASLALTAGLAAVAVGVVWAALALGRGWRSVWWARVADILQSLALALALALLPLSSGLFDAVWRFTS